jgi:DNA modification methylase
VVHLHHGSLALTLQPNRIYQGNCIEKLRQFEAGSVDLVFADPPFNIGYSYDVYDDQRTTTDYLEFCEAWIREVHTALKPNGTFWLAIGDEYAAELKVLSQQLISQPQLGDLVLHVWRQLCAWLQSFAYTSISLRQRP